MGVTAYQFRVQRLLLPSSLSGDAGLEIRLKTLKAPGADRDVLIDFSSVSFVRPSGLAHVYVAAFSLLGKGYNVGISDATTARAQAYMRRAHFWQSLRDCGAEVPEEWLGYNYGNNPGLIECRMIRATLDLHELMDQNADLKERFEGALQAAGVGKNRSATVWAELCGNAAEHSLSEHGAFVMAQVYEKREIEVAIADVGQGMLASLSHLGYQTHQEAIMAALKEGITGRKDAGGKPRDGGWGLYGVRADAHRLFIRSGDGRARNYAGMLDDEKMLLMKPGPCYPLLGTLVTATIFAG